MPSKRSPSFSNWRKSVPPRIDHQDLVSIRRPRTKGSRQGDAIGMGGMRPIRFVRDLRCSASTLLCPQNVTNNTFF
jgi:hypothetical protein